MELIQNISLESLLYLFSFFAIIFISIYFNNERKFKLQPIELLIPGPKSIPWFGNSLNFILYPADISMILYEYVKKYGSRYRLWIGKKLYVVLSDANDVEEVLRNNKFLNKGDDFHEIFGRIFGNGTFSADGAVWKKSRRIIQNPLKTNILENYIDDMNNEANKIVKKLETQAFSNKTFDILNYMEVVSTNIICKTLYNLKQDVDENEIFTFIQKTGGFLDDSFRQIFQPKLLRKIKQMLSKKQFQDTYNKISLLYNKVIAEGKLVKKKTDEELNDARNKTFIECLQEPVFSEKDRKDEINTYSVGGTETLSITLSFTFVMLGIYEEVQKNVYEELHCIFGNDDRDVTEEDLKKMVYLEQVLKEVMRHFPIVPFLFRTNKETTTLRDLVIPPETTVIINVIGLHNNPTYYPDPESFNPERFSIENCQNLQKGCYLPFSGGVRNCIGKAFAMYEMKIICSAILRKYRIHTTIKRENIKLKHSFVINSAHGFSVSISKRLE